MRTFKTLLHTTLDLRQIDRLLINLSPFKNAFYKRKLYVLQIAYHLGKSMGVLENGKSVRALPNVHFLRAFSTLQSWETATRILGSIVLAKACNVSYHDSVSPSPVTALSSHNSTHRITFRHAHHLIKNCCKNYSQDYR